MILPKATKRNIILFITAFLLCGILRIFLYHIDFAVTFSSIFCSGLTILWTITIQKLRIGDFAH